LVKELRTDQYDFEIRPRKRRNHQADTEMKRAAIEKADVPQNGSSLPALVWVDDEDMILRL
jgi:hypothetical protein